MGFTKNLMMAVAAIGVMAVKGLERGYGNAPGGFLANSSPHPIPRMKSRGQGRRPNRSRKHRTRS